MKQRLLFFLIAILCFGCEKNEFDIENPDVNKFVQQLKDGTYNEYETGEDGEKLWTIMPNFKREDIPLLVDHAKDTTLITPWEHFPLNPINSMPPYRIAEGESCIMLGEYLLWCVEGIIKGNGFGSLTPILVKNDEYTELGLNGKEILKVRKYYHDWWEKYGKIGNGTKFPLDATVYHWR